MPLAVKEASQRRNTAVLLVPFLFEGYSMHDASSLRRGNHPLASLVRHLGDRRVGFAVLNPALPGAPQPNGA